MVLLMPTERLAEVAEHELSDFVINSPSYLKDTRFLTKTCPGTTTITKGYTFVLLRCRETISVYSKRGGGMRACQEALEKRQNSIISTNMFLTL